MSPSTPPTQGDLLWSGEHWIAYLRRLGEEEESGMMSLYRAYTSPAGCGTAAFVQIPGPHGFKGCCTNNAFFARFVRETQVVSPAPFDVNMRVIEAELDLRGDVRSSPRWTIQACGHQLECTWLDLDAPLVGPPTMHPGIVFTILVFAAKAVLQVDGQNVVGEPFLREAWARTLGEPKSSCCFALAETMVKN